MAKVYLSVGSNIGDRQKFIRLALKSIADFCKVLKVSSTYETEPWGKTNQPVFLNLCLEIETSLKPKQLLERLKSIEEDLGRTKTDKWAEREIDIDILFYENLILNDPELVLPHPRIEERAFVLVPLEEIAPDYTHPVLQKTIRNLAKGVGNKGVRKQVKIMGVINMTPDSFSDGGELKNKNLLKEKVQEMVSAGVDIIDVGGESTRPGHNEVEAREEIRRVLPAIRAIREISTDISISVDTQKAEVAEKALQAGANIINDVSALSDQNMPQVIKKHDCQIILMRNRPLDEKNLVESCKNQFEEIVENCRALGIDENKIVLDPGLGFGDLASGDFSSLPGGSPSANTQLVLSINDYSLGLPVLIGASRKRFLGEMSGQKNAKKRLAESLAFACLAESCGASIIRVHDFKETIHLQP
ncbi:MAG TPA: dihydropteroate synthase [Candidatus Saccharimonadales bacterium]|nr:dihydropteroate synthase [Candidatus Saccharimonadales bacterium]